MLELPLPNEELARLSDLPPQTLPESNKEFKFTFANEATVSPDCFYIYQSLESVGPAFHDMSIRLEQAFPDLIPVVTRTVKPDMMLAVDEDHEILRAVVLTVNASADTLRVFLVDHADEITVPSSKARLLPKSFCQLEALAIKCRLVLVAPPPGQSQFPAEAAEAMLQWPSDRDGNRTAYCHELEEDGVLSVDIQGPNKDDEALVAALAGRGLLTDLLGEQQLPEPCQAQAEGASLDDVNMESNKSEAAVADEDLRAEGEQAVRTDPKKTWDPMEEEFNEMRNALDAPATDNFQLPREEIPDIPICRFFRDKGKCYRGQSCPHLHVRTGDGEFLSALFWHDLT